MFGNRYIAILILVTFCSLTAAGCGNRKEDSSQSRGIGHSVVKAETAMAVKASLPETRSFTGTVKSKVSVELASKLPGNISDVPVDAGDQVKAGDVVIRIDDTDVKAGIAALEASIKGTLDEKKAVSANYLYAKSTLERMKKLFSEEAATRDELDRAESQFNNLASRMSALDARVATIAAKLEAARNQLKYLVIKSPVNGKVVKRNVDPGTYANPGMPLIVIDSSDDGQWFEADIDSSLADVVRPGTRAVISIPGKGLNLETAITKVSERIDRGSMTFSILVDTGNAGLTPGEFGRIRITTGTVDKTLIPARAVIDLGGLRGVFTVNGKGLAEWRVVRTGNRWLCDKNANRCFPRETSAEKRQDASLFLEALAGVTPDEKIVVSNLDMVKEGCRIE
jgi:RND family efflux transporter MFP subunit